MMVLLELHQCRWVLLTTESAMSSSEVQINLVVSVPVLHSLLGYLMLGGLRFRPYEVHRSLKWSLSCFHYRYHVLATMISTEPTFVYEMYLS